MTSKWDQLIIVGTNALARIAIEYFQRDSAYVVRAVAAERPFLGTLQGFENKWELWIHSFESLPEQCPPSEYAIFVALGYGHMNLDRERLFRQAKAWGYHIPTFISPHAFVWDKSEVGKNCFIMEHNVIQPFTTISDNVIMWSGNHIGHDTTIGPHTFISSHVVISGHCEIGWNCFLGVNATIAHGLKIGNYCVIGAGANVTSDVPDKAIVYGNPARIKGNTDEMAEIG